MTDGARFLKKKKKKKKKKKGSPKSGPKLVFLPFSQVWLIRFP